MQQTLMEGKTFNRLTVVEQHGFYKSKKVWHCKCDCGTSIFVTTGSLTSGNTKSCGCLKRELLTKHGMYKTRTYRIWQAMLNRCRQKQFSHYYGDISVCENWKVFEQFFADMGECPEKMSIDRINPSGNYEPNNCRWANKKTQARNTKRRVEYQHNGIKMSLIEWSEYLGIKHETIRGRIRRGWSFEDAIN